MKKALLIILSVLTGALFLYSAYTKLFPIERFEYTMVEFAHLSWLTAAIAARFFIGLEAGIGSLMILHLFGKNKWILKAAFALLAVFSIYLIYLWITAGNHVNCGCFGDAIWMSPSSSLLKNAALLIIITLLIRYHNGWPERGLQILATILLLATASLPFILYPIPSQQPDWIKQSNYTLDLSPLYAPGKTDAPAIDLRKGKYIIAFLSPHCPYCRMAAYKMHLMKEKNPLLPFFMVIGGKSDLKDFWDKTKAQNIPYTRLEANAFYKLAGYSWPAIYWVKDSRVVAKSTYLSLNQSSIEDWLKK
jgi:hypothetical protein